MQWYLTAGSEGHPGIALLACCRDSLQDTTWAILQANRCLTCSVWWCLGGTVSLLFVGVWLPVSFVVLHNSASSSPAVKQPAVWRCCHVWTALTQTVGSILATAALFEHAVLSQRSPPLSDPHETYRLNCWLAQMPFSA